MCGIRLPQKYISGSFLLLKKSKHLGYSDELAM